MVCKIGFRPEIPAEKLKAQEIYANKKLNLMTSDTSDPPFDPAEYFCLMNQNMNAVEYNACNASVNLVRATQSKNFLQ